MLGRQAERIEAVRTALEGRYVVEEEIGHGGMATVYSAKDVRDGRRLAVKVLHPELSLSLGPRRFQREIQFLSRLSHPGIVPVLDSGEVRGLYYLVMPCLGGESLRLRMERERRLSLGAALDVVHDVASALDHAHGHNIVHRDIKPENILLEGGRAMICDFGVARAIVLSGDAHSSSGLLAGSALYMSPEQILADTEIDGRADFYALGCVLFEMLAGRPPFSGLSARSILARHMSDPPPSLKAVRPDVPDAVERAVHACLAKDRALRPRNGSALLEQIGAAV